jgi:hypothetical protein
VGLLGRETGAMVDWPLAADDELSALVENPILNDSFLRVKRADDSMEGHAEWSYGSVEGAAWKLAETAQVNEGCAFYLGWLYEQLQTDVEAQLEGGSILMRCITTVWNRTSFLPSVVCEYFITCIKVSGRKLGGYSCLCVE